MRSDRKGGTQSTQKSQSPQSRIIVLRTLRTPRILRSFVYLVLLVGPFRENTRFFGDGPNDAHVTTGTWFTPGFDQSHTPVAKMPFSLAVSAGVNVTL